MRPTNGGSVASEPYRVIRGKRTKMRSIEKPKFTKCENTRYKRFMQQTTILRNKIQPKILSSQRTTIQEDDLSAYSDMEDDDTIIEMKRAEDEICILKPLTSSVRPLLQLFSEDSNSPDKALSISKTKSAQALVQTKPQIVYTDIDLSSDEEEIQDEVTAFQIEEELTKLDGQSRFTWTPKSTNIFLDLWEKHLKDIRSKRKNSEIHKEMAIEMYNYGPSSREIKTKMDNMSRKFRMEADKIRRGIPTTWRYFKRVQSLLIGVPADDFEEIIFENSESSTYLRTDNSDADIDINDMSQEDNNLAELRHQQHMDSVRENQAGKKGIDGEETETEHEVPRTTKFYSPEKQTSDRMLGIELEKLLIEKQKLHVMKHISRDLTLISKTLIELLRNTKK